MKKLSLSLFLLILCIFIYSSKSEIYLAGQPEYFPLIEGTHMDAYEPAVDANGRYVAFSTSIPLSTEHEEIFSATRAENTLVYVYDRVKNTYELISKTPDGKALKYGFCRNIKISHDGRFIGFCSISFEFVPFSYELHYGLQIYLRDQYNQVNTIPIQTIDGNLTDQDCTLHALNSDGRLILFSSKSSKLVENDTNQFDDIFIHDRQTGVTRRISVTSDNRETNSFNYYPSMSDDGRWIVFNSPATNWIEEKPSPEIWPSTPRQTILKDIKTGEATILSTDWKGDLGTGQVQETPQISDDGQWVAFLYSSPLLPDLPEAWVYVYLFDVIEKKLKMICPLNPQHKIFEDAQYAYSLNYKIVMSGNGRYLFWYQGRYEYDSIEVVRYDRLSETMDRILYTAKINVNNFDASERFIGNSVSVNYDGSVFVFTTGAKELTPLWNQGNYQNRFPYPLWPSYRLLLLDLSSMSQTGGWSLFR